MFDAAAVAVSVTTVEVMGVLEC